MKKYFILFLLFTSCNTFKQNPKPSEAGQDASINQRAAAPAIYHIQNSQVNRPNNINSYDYAFNVQELGVTPANKKNNAALLQAFISKLPEGATKNVFFPAGEYYFESTITLKKRPLRLFGESGTIWGNSTKLIFPRNTTGIKVDRAGTSIQETTIERICLIGGGGDGSNGNGIHANARIKLRDVTFKGFSQNGLLIWANMEEGGDASGSSVEFCHALQNGHDGFLAGRTDANAITFIGCDARDNGRYGFNDDSFLGNNFFSCMAHYNKKGDYFVRDWGNARSLFMGCYSEGGNTISQLGPHSSVLGGIWGTPYKLGNKK
jgi:hypothetical protein